MNNNLFILIRDKLASILTIITILGTITLFIWQFISDELSVSVRSFMGQDVIVDRLTYISSSIITMNSRIAELEKDLYIISPYKKFIEYDVLRSIVDNNCKIGEQCQLVLRARKSDFSQNCFKHIISSISIVDSTGVRNTITKGIQDIIPVSDAWSNHIVTFAVPSETKQGVAEIYLTIDTLECSVNNTVINFSENSPRFVFTVH